MFTGAGIGNIEHIAQAKLVAGIVHQGNTLAVSYTHLDVYKRQVMLLETGVPVAKTTPRPPVISSISVSYTHLSSVGNSLPVSTNPHFSHFSRICVSIGMFSNSQSWLM